MRRSIRILLAILLAAGFAAAVVYAFFERDLAAARARVAEGGRAIETAAGTIQYGEGGSGPPLLFVHGAGGGFDAGLADGRNMTAGGYRIIAPSRFGYLGTPVPPDASPAAQADAHAALLDAVGVARVPVIAVSAGARSALELALRHPGRVAALVLVVPGTWSPDTPPIEETRRADFPLLLWLVSAGADFAWWSLEKLAPSVLVRFVGVPPELLDDAPPSEREAVMTIIRNVQPVSRRFVGIGLDGAPDLHELPLETLSVPTLIVSARDDLFVTLPPAEHAASRIPGAELLVFETGGHLLVGHGEEVTRRIRAFLSDAGMPPS